MPRWLLFCVVLICSVKGLHSQDKYAYYPWQIDTLVVPDHPISEIQLSPHHRIVEQSMQVTLNRVELDDMSQFHLDQDQNRVQFFMPVQSSDSVRIRYQILPVLLQKNYTYFQIDTSLVVLDTTDTVTVIKPVFENPFADVGGGLKRSGSIVRGINIGSNKDLTLNSGLNLQLSGKLTEDLEIVAALTDESTPIQPEGNTQTLREIDKVFIRFNSPWVSGVLGDFNLSYSGAEFGSFSRKLQGISLTGNYNDFLLGGSVASTRGFFNFLSFVGQEGNQGPYQLLGKNGEKEIIVLAGTERVWVNGQKLVRGENNDYVIEYGNGQITFTNKQLITSESRIEIDYEYYPATQKYTRNVYSGLTSGHLFDKTINYRISYYHEEDDPDKILEEEGILSDQDRQIIEDAGDDPLMAAKDGAVFVGDSLGYYTKVDTLIENEAYSYYQYVGEKAGDYIVIFSSVGPGKGDYVREGLGVFRWVGIGRGDYLPIELLPLPSRQQLLDVQLGYRYDDRFQLNAEAALSNLDQNTISKINDKDNQGNAYSLSATLNNTTLNLGGTDLGRLAFDLRGKKIDKKFQPVDRLNQPDFNRYWNVLPSTEKTNEEESVEFKSTYLPWQWLTINGSMGSLTRNEFRSFRYHLDSKWDAQDWFRGQIRHERIVSRQQEIQNNWLRQKADINKDIGFLQPAFLFEREERKNTEQNTINGFSFLDLGARIRLISSKILSGYVQYNQRKDEVFDPERGGEKIHQATSQTRRLRLDLAEWNHTSGYMEIVLRKKDYTPFFEELRVDSVKERYLDIALQDTSWQDRQTNLIEFLLRNYQWNRALDVQWQYRISVGQTALREKVYIDVGDGNGDFRFDESLGEYVPDPNGKFVLFIVPSGRFEPISNLGTSLRLMLDPGRILKGPQNIFSRVISQLSSESYVRIEEESKDENLSNLYFLRLSTFQGPNTVRGSVVFNQDLHYMRRNRNLSFRLRYRYRDDLFNQFLDPDDNEERLAVERGVWADYRVFEGLKVQTEVRSTLTFRNNKSNLSRNRDINGIILNQNFSYRPDQNWEFGVESELGNETDLANQKDLKINYLRGLLRTSYAFLGKGKISSSFDYQMVRVLNNPTDASIPFEMARGKKEGISKSWQFRAEYTIAKNVLIAVFYNGRDDADFDKIIHTGQAEIRAYF